MLSSVTVSSPGTYCLALSLPRTKRLTIGKLGRFLFEHGIYLYAGSALGPGGLAARLRHHCRSAPRPRWHVDYLRKHADPVAAFLRYAKCREECRWAQMLRQIPILTGGPHGFGSSDCRCPGHLFFLGPGSTRELETRVGSFLPPHELTLLRPPTS